MEGVMQVLMRHSRERPDRVALANGASTLDYGVLPAVVETRRRCLLDSGCRVLGIDLDNCIDWLTWDLAASVAEVVCVPLPSFFTNAQRSHACVTAGIDMLVSAAGLQVMENDAVPLPPGTAKVTFTSGSTGAPKGVCLPFDGLERVARSIRDALDKLGCERHFCALPLSVLLENVAGAYTALMTGCRIDVPSRAANWMDPEGLLGALASHRAHTVILVPELLQGLVAAMEQTGARLPELRFAAVGGARVSPTLIRRARCLELPVYQGYGLSECGSVVSLNTPDADRADTAGQALKHVDLRIDNGEIVITNPVYLGYLGGRAPGELHTGDLGGCDQNGFVSIHGRCRNVLVTSWGRNVSPEWIESELLSQPEVDQALVCGDGWSQPGALIAARANVDDASIADALARTNASLPDYARVAGWARVPLFSPENGFLTGTGRLRRQRIIDHYINVLESKMSQMEFYHRLLEATDDARQELYAVPQLRDGLAGRINRQTYIAYLAQAYHHVRHTVPLLMAMGARLPEHKEWIRRAVIDYINEENGHEEWILGDIEAAGGDLEAVRRSEPNLETQVLVAYNYDYIQRRNPLGFLGMVFMLESTSTQLATRGAAALQNALELPREAFTYLYSHGELDQAHMKFYRGLVNRIDDANDQAAIIEVASNTFRLFAGVLRSIPHERGVRNVA